GRPAAQRQRGDPLRGAPAVSGPPPPGSRSVPSPASPPVDPVTPPEPRVLIPDVSGGVKWYVPESDSEAAGRLLDLRFSLHGPAYFFTEAASVLQRKAAVEATLAEAEALEAYRLLRTVPMTVHATDGLLEDAIRHGIRYRRPVY